MTAAQPINQTARMLLQLLKREGPSDAAELASHLGISAIAVRRYLAILQQRNLVTYNQQSRSLGRPVRVWWLTPAAEVFFPDAHAVLASSLLQSAEDAFGSGGLRQMLSNSVRQQVEAYRAAMPTEAPLKERLEALARLRTQDGYMAELDEQEDGSFLFIENHCPIFRAASQCSQLCKAELEIFEAALGEKIPIKREEHMLGGACRCVYRIGAVPSHDDPLPDSSESLSEATSP